MENTKKIPKRRDRNWSIVALVLWIVFSINIVISFSGGPLYTDVFSFVLIALIVGLLVHCPVFLRERPSHPDVVVLFSMLNIAIIIFSIYYSVSQLHGIYHEQFLVDPVVGESTGSVYTDSQSTGSQTWTERVQQREAKEKARDRECQAMLANWKKQPQDISMIIPDDIWFEQSDLILMVSILCIPAILPAIFYIMHICAPMWCSSCAGMTWEETQKLYPKKPSALQTKQKAQQSKRNMRAREKAYQQIAVYHDYLERGVMTQEEYEDNRRRILETLHDT